MSNFYQLFKKWSTQCYCVLPKLDGIRMDLLGSHFDEKGEKRKKAHAFICKNSCPEIYF